jgi:hypothetical protein
MNLRLSKGEQMNQEEPGKTDTPLVDDEENEPSEDEKDEASYGVDLEKDDDDEDDSIYEDDDDEEEEPDLDDPELVEKVKEGEGIE